MVGCGKLWSTWIDRARIPLNKANSKYGGLVGGWEGEGGWGEEEEENWGEEE